MAWLASQVAGTGCSARRGFEGHGCCPRRPLVPMIGYARPLLVWWVQEVPASSAMTGSCRGRRCSVRVGRADGRDTFVAALSQAAAAVSYAAVFARSRALLCT